LCRECLRRKTSLAVVTQNHTHGCRPATSLIRLWNQVNLELKVDAGIAECKIEGLAGGGARGQHSRGGLRGVINVAAVLIRAAQPVVRRCEVRPSMLAERGQ